MRLSPPGVPGMEETSKAAEARAPGLPLSPPRGPPPEGAQRDEGGEANRPLGPTPAPRRAIASVIIGVSM
jgi:hypothetical protein